MKLSTTSEHPLNPPFSPFPKIHIQVSVSPCLCCSACWLALPRHWEPSFVRLKSPEERNYVLFSQWPMYCRHAINIVKENSNALPAVCLPLPASIHNLLGQFLTIDTPMSTNVNPMSTNVNRCPQHPFTGSNNFLSPRKTWTVFFQSLHLSTTTC